MRSKNLPTNELGLNSEGKEIVEARMLVGVATKDYPHLLLVPFPPSRLNWVASAGALTFWRLEPVIISLDLVSREKSMS